MQCEMPTLLVEIVQTKSTLADYYSYCLFVFYVRECVCAQEKMGNLSKTKTSMCQRVQLSQRNQSHCFVSNASETHIKIENRLTNLIQIGKWHYCARDLFLRRSCDRLIHSVQPFVCVMLHTTCIEIAPVELNGTKSQIKPNENQK